MPYKILDYLPEVLQGVQDYQCIAGAEDPELDRDLTVNAVENEQYVDSATLYGIRRRESILAIIPDESAESILFRRRRILARYQDLSPYTLPILIAKLDILLGHFNYTLTTDFDHYALYVQMNAPLLLGEAAALQEMARMVPCNIKWTVAEYRMRFVDMDSYDKTWEEWEKLNLTWYFFERYKEYILLWQMVDEFRYVWREWEAYHLDFSQLHSFNNYE